MNKKDKFIHGYHGGLGDQLQFSTLPERFSELGHNVYALDGAYYRNLEIYDLVWGCNPFIKGKKFGEWNVGDTPEIKYTQLHKNCISNWEMLHGLEPKNLYPKIYYQPKKIDKKDYTLIDLSSISTDHNPEYLHNELNDLLKTRCSNSDLCYIKYKKNLNPPNGGIRGHSGKFNSYDVNHIENEILIENIFQYCDAIFSAKNFISLHSGGHSLASAIQNDYNKDLQIFCIITDSNYQYSVNRSSFIFDNVEYHLIKE